MNMQREEFIRSMSDQEVRGRYVKETLNLKTLKDLKRQGKKRPRT